ncbi:MAG: glycosyltransferase family 4 protein [Patescibacteria group bacterium]
MQKPNVLLFLNSFWNNGAGISGGDQIVLQVYRRLRSNLGKVYCYTNTDGRQILSDQIDGITFFVSSARWDGWNLYLNYLLRTLKATFCLRLSNIDVIHSSSDFLPDIWPAFIYKLCHPQTKWVANIMHIYPDWRQRPGNKLNNLVAQSMQKASFTLIQKADQVLVLNKSVQNDLIKLHFLKEKIQIIPAGIDYDYFQKIPKQKPSVGYQASFMARLKPSKGIFDLIPIWKEVIKEFPTARLAVIGGGGEDKIIDQLKYMIKEANLEKNIKILGHLPNDLAFTIIKNSQIFIFPSHEEGFGIAIAEAMACGVPVVAWDLMVYKDIFRHHVQTAPENNILDFSKQIRKLMKQKLFRIQHANRGREFIKRYSWQAVANQYKQVLTS